MEHKSLFQKKANKTKRLKNPQKQKASHKNNKMKTSIMEYR